MFTVQLLDTEIDTDRKPEDNPFGIKNQKERNRFAEGRDWSAGRAGI